MEIARKITITIWTAFILIAIASSIYYRRKLAKPLKF